MCSSGHLYLTAQGPVSLLAAASTLIPCRAVVSVTTLRYKAVGKTSKYKNFLAELQLPSSPQHHTTLSSPSLFCQTHFSCFFCASDAHKEHTIMYKKAYG